MTKTIWNVLRMSYKYPTTGRRGDYLLKFRLLVRSQNRSDSKSVLQAFSYKIIDCVIILIFKMFWYPHRCNCAFFGQGFEGKIKSLILFLLFSSFELHHAISALLFIS